MSAPNHFSYVVTAHPPSCVYHTITGSFASPDDINLVVGHGTRFVMYRLGSDGLEVVADVPIYGRIASLHKVRLPNDPIEGRDSILFLTERYHMCIISWDAATNQFITRTNINVSSRIGRPAEEGPRSLVDPDMRAIGMHLYNGTFKIIPLSPDTGAPLQPFDVELDEPQVLDLQFLHHCSVPTLCVRHCQEFPFCKVLLVPCLKKKTSTPTVLT